MKPIFTICLTILIVCTINIVEAQTFKNVAIEQGIDKTWHDNPKYFGGDGVSFYDFTGNGWDDITFAERGDSIVFYVNNKGSLERVSSYIHVEGKIKQVIWVDYNNNGKLDLAVTVNGEGYRLFENKGNFNFVDVTDKAGLNPPESNSFGITFADFNKNGCLDFYVANYSIPWQKKNHKNILYKNNCDGTFTDVTKEAGVADSIKPSFMGVWADFNNNGWPDLFVNNDRILWENSLYINNKDGTFINITDSANVGLKLNDPMSASVTDFNNNGLLDIFMTNNELEFVYKEDSIDQKGMLLTNQGNAVFKEKAANYNLNLQVFGWGSVWIDYNNNSFNDLYYATAAKEDDINYFFENIKGNKFEMKNEIFKGEHKAKSFGVAKGDLMNNGFYDILVQNDNEFIPFLWENSGGENNFIKITLEGVVSNRQAIGSWIEVYVDSNKFVKYTQLGENYIGQDSQHQIFGLRQYEKVDSVIVKYSLGHIDRYYDLDVNQHYYFKEGETLPALKLPESVHLCSGDTVELSVDGYADFKWNNGAETSNIQVTEQGKYWVKGFSDTGVPVYSDTVEVKLHTPPVIIPEISRPACFNSQDGSIEIWFDEEPVIDFEVIWKNHDNGKKIKNLADGNYSYLYKDQAGCIKKGTVELNAPSEIIVQKRLTDATDTTLGSVQLEVRGGKAPYSIFLNEKEVDKKLENLKPGKYDLKIVDENGCVKELSFYIKKNNTSLRKVEEIKDLILYPNPVKNAETINIQTHNNFRIVEIKLLSPSGMLVKHRTDEEHDGKFFEIDVSDISAGLYFCFISNIEGDTFVEKVLIK